MEKVSDWMGAPLIAVRSGTALDEAAHTLVENRIRHLPVLRSDDRCLGVLSDMGVFAMGNWLSGRWVQQQEADVDRVAEPVRAMVHPTDEVALALVAMRDARADHALVLTDEGVPVGIFTEHDVVRYGAVRLSNRYRLPRGRLLRCVPPGLDVTRALSAMLDWNVRHLLVMEGDDLLGMVSVRDLVIRPGAWTVRQAMPAGPVRELAPDARLREAAATMERTRVGSLVVLEDGRPAAVVTRSDIARALLFDAGADEETDPLEA